MKYGISLGEIKDSLEITRNLGLSAVQIFTADPYKFDNSFDKVKKLIPLVKSYSDITLVSHSSLMTNLVSEKEKTKVYSINSLCTEMIRCGILGINTAVFHPGSCIANGVEELANSVLCAIRKAEEKGWTIIDNICIENMVDSGNHIMTKPEDFILFFNLVKDPRVKICLDTCHCWGAGYSPREFIYELERNRMLDRLKVIHFNNSQLEKGCHKERHAELFGKGLGKIPLEELYWLADFAHTMEDLIVIEEQPKECDVVQVSEDLIKAMNGVKLFYEISQPIIERKDKMITLTGSSVVPVNLIALQDFLNSFIKEEQLQNFSVKFDARPNVKSTFLKMDEAAATIYTGAVASEGLSKFAGESSIQSEFDVLMFIILFMLKKAIKKESYDFKLSDSNMSYARMDDDFEKTSQQVQILVSKFIELFPNGREVLTSKSTSTSSSTKSVGNPNKFTPLVNTPEVEIPEDLDLLGV